MVVGLIGFERFGKEEWAPVREPAHDATGAQDEGAGIAGHSVSAVSLEHLGREDGVGLMVLFDFVDIARSNLLRCGQ